VIAHPSQDRKYVVEGDKKSSRERVALAHGEIETYDASYYETHWSERSRACFHRSGGTDPTFVESSPVRGTPF